MCPGLREDSPCKYNPVREPGVGAAPPGLPWIQGGEGHSQAEPCTSPRGRGARTQ